MSLIDALLQQIKQTPLTKTEKKIADYIVDNINTIGLQTVTSLAYEIGVSDTSIIRLVRKLGFHSYAEFKRNMSTRMIQQYNEALLPSEKYIKTRETLDKSNLISDVVNRTIENLRKSCDILDLQTIERIAAILIRSNHKYIVGFRSTASCATYMSSKLLYFVPNVICCNQAESMAIEHIVDIKQDDCLLLYSFPRYSEVNLSLLEIAKRQGAATILITDRITSPLATLADFVLPAAIDGLGFTNSYIVPICISEIILFAVNGQTNNANNERVYLLDDYLGHHHLY